MAVQVFRTDQELFEIGALTVDQMVWFKGNDVATCLGYERHHKAVIDHVVEGDKRAYASLVQGGPDMGPPSNQQPHEVYVNKSVLYSPALRLRHHLPMRSNVG